MTDQTPGAARRRRLLLGGGAGAVVAVGLVLALTSGGAEPAGDAEASPSSSATSAPSPSDTPATPPSPTDPASDGGVEPSPGAEPTTGEVPVGPVTPSGTERPDGRAEATVPLEQPAELRSGLTARISQIEPVEAIATLPGEVGGPGLRVTVEVRNDTSSPVELTSAVVNAYVGPDAVPATSVIQPGSEPFPATVEPGQSATAKAVFTIPEADRADVRFELDLSLEDVIVLFTGDASDA